MDGQSRLSINWVKVLSCRICHMGLPYKKTIPSGGGAVVVLRGGVEPVIWAWPVGPARFHANPRRAGPAVLVEK